MHQAPSQNQPGSPGLLAPCFGFWSLSGEWFTAGALVLSRAEAGVSTQPAYIAEIQDLSQFGRFANNEGTSSSCVGTARIPRVC
jgi:hypothetical protein